MTPVGTFDRVDVRAGDSEPSSTIPDWFARFPDPILAPIGRNNLVGVL